MAIKHYAWIENNKVENIAVWETEPIHSPNDNGKWIDVTDKQVGIGYSYDSTTGEFTAPQVQSTQPTFVNKLVLTSLTSDDTDAIIDPDFKEITIHENQTVTADFEVHNISDDSLNTNYSGTFRAPLIKQTGDIVYILVTITNGKGTLNIKMPSPASGLWQVKQDKLNEKLPDESKLQFVGLNIYVVL